MCLYSCSWSWLWLYNIRWHKSRVNVTRINVEIILIKFDINQMKIVRNLNLWCYESTCQINRNASLVILTESKTAFVPPKCLENVIILITLLIAKGIWSPEVSASMCSFKAWKLWFDRHWFNIRLSLALVQSWFKVLIMS